MTDTAPQPHSKRLTVGLFTDNYGPGHSGLLYAVQFLEQELLKAGHRVLLVAPKSSGPNPFATDPRRREVRLPSMNVPGMAIRMATGADFELRLEQLAANPPDVIHVHGLGPVGLLGVWVAKRANIPLMVTWHTDLIAYAEHYWHLTPFLNAAYTLLETNVQHTLTKKLRKLRFKRPKRGASIKRLTNLAISMLEDADLVTTPSEKTAQRCLEIAPKARVLAVPNGADALPSGEPIPHGPGPRLLYVGRIAPEKGISLLLDAFEIVQQQIPDAELMFVGDWQKSPGLRITLANAARKGGVTLIGQVPRDHLGPYYASSDVFVFPSLTDTQALVLHEAAHARLPLVTVDEDLRLVVDPGVNALIAQPTPEDLAATIVTMLDKLKDPAFKARATARSKELANKWTIAHQSGTLLSLYEDLAAHRPIDVLTYRTE